MYGFLEMPRLQYLWLSWVSLTHSASSKVKKLEPLPAETEGVCWKLHNPLIVPLISILPVHNFRAKTQNNNSAGYQLTDSTITTWKSIHIQKICLFVELTSSFSLSLPPSPCNNFPRQIRTGDFLFQIDVLQGMRTMVQSAIRRKCGKACHLVVNSHAVGFSVSMTCCVGHITDQSFLLYKDVCLLEVYITKIQQQRPTLTETTLISIFLLLLVLSFLLTPPFLPLTPSLLSAQQLNCLFHWT